MSCFSYFHQLSSSSCNCSASLTLLLIPTSVFLISVTVLLIVDCFNFSRSLLNKDLCLPDPCLHLSTRFWVIFSIITLNSFSGRLPISSSFVWSYGFLPFSFICIFLCLSILFILLCLGSPFCRLEGHSCSELWSLPAMGGVGLVPCEGFLFGGTCAHVLMDGAGFHLSGRQCHGQ